VAGGIDFEAPQDAPSVRLGGHDFYFVTITNIAKTDLVSFDLRDDMAAAVLMPASRQTTEYLGSALVYCAPDNWFCQAAAASLCELRTVTAMALTASDKSGPTADQLSRG
jgi:hypothetical protein